MFGVCDAVLVDGRMVARFQAVDWDRPASIPPLDRPGALPAGAGTAILNYLAGRAAASSASRENRPLRYRGPYPTGALFDSLLECFRVDDPQAAFARFNAGVEMTALTGALQEVPVDFAPAPFHRVWADQGVCVQIRDGVEKIFVHGRGYSRHAAGPRRVRRYGRDEWAALIELGGKQWTEIVRVSEDGRVTEGPRSLPSPNPAWCGRPLPEGLRASLLEALPPRAPALLRPTLQQVLGSTALVWDDTADDAAAIRDQSIAVHAALPELLADAPPLSLMEAIARAVEPVAQRLAQQILHRTLADLERKLSR